MSKVLLLCSVIFFCATHGQTTNQPLGASAPLTHDQVQKQEYEKQKAQLCTYFSQLVGNFLNIVQNPHNSAHVSGNVADILNNVVNIAMSCVGRAMNRIKRSGMALTVDDIEQIKEIIVQELADYEEVIRAVIIERTETLEIS